MHTQSALKSKSTFQPKRFQFGQGMTEYIVIVALIAVAAIGVFGFFGDAIEHQMAGLTQEISGGTAGGEITNAQTAATSAGTAASQHKNLGNYNTNSQGGAGAE